MAGPDHAACWVHKKDRLRAALVDKLGKEREVMAKIKNYDGQTDMELSYVAVQATRPKKKTVDWVGITETFIAGGMWVIVFMMLGAALAVQVL